MSKFKLHINLFISIVLITIVLLPFVVQFTHAFEKHEYSVCNTQDIVHIHNHKTDCSVFHFQINYNTIDFSSNFLFETIKKFEEKIYASEGKNPSTNLNHKSTRAPPSLLL